jgi:hypothetical protein
MTTTILIILGVVIVAAAVITWVAIIRSRARQDAINEKIVELLSKIISDTSELDAFRCNRKCGNRRTPHMYDRLQLEKVGLDAYCKASKELDEETEQGSGDRCNDCVIADTCERRKHLNPEIICSDFELDDDH